MNPIIIWIIRRKWQSLGKENPIMVQTIIFIATRIFWIAALIVKEWGIITGIVKQILKALAGLASLSPTRKDDAFVTAIDDLFNKAQDRIYSIATAICGWYGTFGKITGK